MLKHNEWQLTGGKNHSVENKKMYFAKKIRLLIQIR